MPQYRIKGTDIEVCVARPPSNTVTEPNEAEHAALDAYFADRAHWHPRTGEPYTLTGADVPGVHGLVMTYPLNMGE